MDENECWSTLFKLRYKDLLDNSVVVDPSRNWQNYFS